MVICTENSNECNNTQTSNPDYFKLKHYQHNGFVHDGNNNNTSTVNNNNITQNTTNKNNNLYDGINSSLDVNRHSIKAFYQNSTILVTGGTGFLGKVLLEKLLRSCENIQCIYVLLRAKRGLSSEERYKELIQNPVSE